MRRLKIEGTKDARKTVCSRAWSVVVWMAATLFLCGGTAQLLRGADSSPEPVFSVDSGVFTNAAITFSISTPVGGVRYTLDGSVPSETSLFYGGPITVDTNVVIKARTFAAGFPPGPVVSRVYQFLDASAAAFTSDLPVMILSTGGRSIPQNVPPGQPRVPGSLVVIDTFRGRCSLQSSPQFIGLAEYEVFGQTATGFPKVPYIIEIQDEYRNDRAVPLLGMPAEADWRLRALYNDKSLINEALAFEIFEQMGHYALRRRFVEVFADTSGGRVRYPQDYLGVMMLLEKIEIGPDRVAIQKLSPSDTTEPEITGGYIWKKEKDSVGDLNFSTGSQFLKLHEPKPREVTTQQLRWLTNHLRQFESALNSSNWLTATGTNHYSHYIDVDSFVDQHWIVEFTKNIDGYRLGNFMRKDRGGKIRMDLLWDWELSLGNANYLGGGATNGWYFPFLGATDHIWLRRLIAGGANTLSQANPWGGAGDPDFVQKIIDRWGELRTNAFSSARILPRVDELAGQLAEGAARDNTRFPRLGVYIWPQPNGAGKNGDSFPPEGWHVDYVTPNTYAGIISELKKWIAGRHAWFDGQFLRAPVFNHPGGVVESGFNLVVGTLAGTTYYTLDGTDPRAPGGGISATARSYNGPIIITENARIFARARRGGGMADWSPPAIGTFIVTPSPLRVTELMYHPATDPPVAEADHEYIELRNTGTAPLRVGGYRLTGAVEFNFPDSVLGPGEYVLVVKNRSAFSPSLPVIGEYAGDLGNDGERIILQGRFGEVILDFSYDDGWYPATDGHGFSLVINDDHQPQGSWDLASGWRPSGQLGGSPGTADPASPAIANVVINEALVHAAPPDENAVEVQNLSSESVDLEGWYLTDDPDHPRKFRIPLSTVVPPGAFRVFTESDFGSAGADGALVLSRTGGKLYLFSGDPAGELTGYATGVEFGPQESGVSFGRHVTSTGEKHFVAQATVTLGGVNSGPRVGPIIVSEIMYRPLAVVANGRFWDNTEEEYIELFNAGSSTVALYDPTHPANVWKLAGAVEFEFPLNTAILPGGFLILVNFDPTREPARLAAFRSAYGLSPSTPILGPWIGSLPNDATLALLKPDASFEEGPEAGSVPYVLVEQVAYSNSPPWPIAADGTGFSLNRVDERAYADDPANWFAANPNPDGRPAAAAPPVIVTQPQGLDAVTFENAILTVGVDGTGPFRYQWRRNGVILNTETNASLVISNVQPSVAGVYQVLVLNKTGAVLSSDAVINVLIKVAITEHPQSVTTTAGSSATFVVAAESQYPIRYQWRFNGTNLPGATNRILNLNNITNVHDGTYTVVCTDTVGTVVSRPAQLTVRLRAILVAPTPPVHLTAVAGDNVTLGVQLLGDIPIHCRWRLFRVSGGQILSDQVLTGRTSFITVPVTTSSAGAYTVILSNASWGFMNTAYTNAFLTVLADTDGDRMPDEFEDANRLDRQNPADGAPGADADNDGSSNRAEYLAGTDPQDPASFLRVQAVPSAGVRTLQFGAAADRTYTIQYTDTLAPGVWQKLTDILAGTVSRVETVVDPDANAATRFYRVVTPRQP